MKPLSLDLPNDGALQELGRASVQIIHDLKNQINGLKLYATFLKRRMERDERAADELETVGKLMSGLERIAADMSLLVRYGRPVELKRQPRVDLAKMVGIAAVNENVESQIEGESFEGDYDPAALGEALKDVTAVARTFNTTNGATANEDSALQISLKKTLLAGRMTSCDDQSNDKQVLGGRTDANGSTEIAEIIWSGVQLAEGDDPFHSFAGGNRLRLALAAKVICAHGGTVSHAPDSLRARLPLTDNE